MCTRGIITSKVGNWGLSMLQLRGVRDPTSRLTEDSPNANTSCGEAEETSGNGVDAWSDSLSAAGECGVLATVHSMPTAELDDVS